MIAFLALASAFAAPAADDAVFLTVAYCPDLFSGMGAVVRVNHTDGAFTIQGKFALPSSSIGCPMNEDVNYFSDVRRSASSPIASPMYRWHFGCASMSVVRNSLRAVRWANGS